VPTNSKATKGGKFNWLLRLFGAASGQSLGGLSSTAADLLPAQQSAPFANLIPSVDIFSPLPSADMGRPDGRLSIRETASSSGLAAGRNGPVGIGSLNLAATNDRSPSLASAFASKIRLTGQADAAAVTWKPDADGNWSDPVNWSDGTLPVDTDSVTVATSDFHTITHSTGDDAVMSLAVTGDLLSMTGGSLSVLSTAEFANGLDQSAGNLNLASNSSITGLFNQSAGTLSIAQDATLTVENTNLGSGFIYTPELDGPGTLSTLGTTTVVANNYLEAGVDLDARLVWLNGGVVNAASLIQGGDASGTVTLTNLANGIINLNSDSAGLDNADYYVSTSNGSTLIQGDLDVINQGVLAKTGGSGTSEITAAVNSTGTITSNSGTLQFDGGGTFGGVLNGAGFVDFGGGSSTLATGVDISNANLEIDDGEILFADPQMHMSGTLYQTGGIISIASGDVLETSGSVQIAVPAYGADEIDGPGTLSTSGTATISSSSLPDQGLYLGGGLVWSNAGIINDSDYLVGGDSSGVSATLLNLAGATLNLTTDFSGLGNSSFIGHFYDGALSVVNHGTIAKTAGSGITTVAVPVVSDGTITAASPSYSARGRDSLAGIA
jgi:hypothetical protein